MEKVLPGFNGLRHLDRRAWALGLDPLELLRSDAGDIAGMAPSEMGRKGGLTCPTLASRWRNGARPASAGNRRPAENAVKFTERAGRASALPEEA
jgi:hypothetical protein